MTEQSNRNRFQIVIYNYHLKNENPADTFGMSQTAYGPKNMMLEVWNLENNKGQISLIHNYEQVGMWEFNSLSEAEATLYLVVAELNRPRQKRADILSAVEALLSAD